MANPTHVISFEEGLTSTGRFPYVLARLACGHVASVQLRATTGTCCGCGTTLSHAHGKSFKRCACGTYSATNINSPRPDVPSDRLLKIGDVVDCETCAKDADRLAWLNALDPSTIHHARFDPRFTPGSYHLYRHDVASPSGFFLIGSVPATPTFDEALRRIRVSPISPTECA